MITSAKQISSESEIAVHDVLIFLWGKNAFSLSRIPNYWSFHMIWVWVPSWINQYASKLHTLQSITWMSTWCFIHRRVAQMNLRDNRSVWRTQLLIITDFTSLTLIYFFFLNQFANEFVDRGDDNKENMKQRWEQTDQ